MNQNVYFLAHYFTEVVKSCTSSFQDYMQNTADSKSRLLFFFFWVKEYGQKLSKLSGYSH